MSKLSKLKQEAYLAGKKQNWDEAVSIYKRILEIDKNNPTLVNELGDICLRTNDLKQAIEYFLSAASSYRKTGLQNNAVAIYKKILRHDGGNLNAHWYLAEIRAGQGLLVEGETHAVTFLAAAEGVSQEFRELFVKRCVKMLGLYPRQKEVLERLLQVFRLWSMGLEEARVVCLQNCLLFDSGQEEQARQQMENLIAAQPEVEKYPEFAGWRKRVDPDGQANEYSDVNALDLSGGDAGPNDPAVAPDKMEEGIEKAASSEEQSGEDAVCDAAGASLDDLISQMNSAGAPAPENVEPDEPLNRDEQGCYEIDADTSASLADLFDEDTDAEATSSPEQEVDLLAEILAEEGPELATQEANQVQTIASEISQVVGGDGSLEDAGRKYEMGMVYLEMGMFDQAADCFSGATEDTEHALRSFEMWGITLLRLARPDQAIEVLERGLEIPKSGEKEKLGLIYHLGRAHEQAGRLPDARRCYERAHGIAPTFLDLEKRLADLAIAT